MVGRPHLSYPLCLAFNFLASNLAAQTPEPPASVYMSAKVRDFKEANHTDSLNTHPHFNVFNACSAQEMGAPTVADALATNNAVDGGVFPGDERGPTLRNDMPAELRRCFEPFERFSDWFQDKGAAVNRVYRMDLRFNRDPATGLYTFQDREFFPVDDGMEAKKFNAADPESFGHLQNGTFDGKDLTLHNYGFTMEIHSRIVYVAGQGHRLSFEGDDDIWVFLNGRKVIDMGGVHQTQSASVNLDSIAPTLGLQNGLDYPMDFFSAERHVASSSIKITANLHLGSVGIRPGASRKSAGLVLAAGTPVEFFDRSGRLVRELRPDRDLSPESLWDGKDASGKSLAQGVYFWRAKSMGSKPALSGWVMSGGRRG